MSFNELGLSEPLMRAVAELGYETPTPIQQQAIPAVLRGGDLLAGAQTGTGKTAGFALPILELLKKTQKPGAKPVVRTLVLVPTRELAAQVEASFKEYGKYMKLKSMMMFGGVGINPQIDQLRRGVDILVATPGRLLDHMQQGTVDLSHVEILVLDEADRMLDMGFIRDIKRVLAVLPRKRQNLLFSATFSDEIKALADGLLNAPEMIEVARRNTTAEGVAQRVYPVDRERKRELLTHLIRTHDWFQLLVFTRTKHGANRLAEQLNKDGITALAIHGNKSQSARTRALAEFKDATLQVLVATDIAARGIDIDQLPHVINYDLPNVPEDYVHRIGRTGRAGASGEALSLVSIDDKPLLADIEKLIRRSIPTEIVPGFEPDPSILPEPPAARRQGGQRQGQGQRGAPKRVASAEAGSPRSKPAGRGAASPGRGDGASAGRGDGRQGQSRASVSSAGGRMAASDAVRRDRADAARPERKVGGLEPRSGDARGEHRRPVKTGGNPGALLSGSQKR